MKLTINPQIVVTNPTLLRWAGFRLISPENARVEMPLSTWLMCLWWRVRRWV